MTSDDAVREANSARCFGESLEARGALVRALSRMPADVRATAVDHCVFLTIGGVLHGQCLPTDLIGDAEWIVQIDERLSPRSLESAIAHEVAHAILGHRIDGAEPADEIEKEARRLARSWGFRGFGAEATYGGQPVDR